MDFFHRHRLLFQALVALLSLALLAWRIEPVEALRGLRGVNGWWLALGAAFVVLATAVEGYRWWLLLSQRKRVPLRQIVLLYALSRLANIVLPMRGGDVVRIQIAGRRFGISRVELTGTVFAVETPLNWVTSLTVLFIAVGLFDLPFLRLPYARSRFALVGAGLLIAVFLGAVVLSRTAHSLDLARLWPVRLLPQGVRDRLGELFRLFVQGTGSLRESGRLAAALAASSLIWLVQTAMFWCLGEAFGLPLAPAQYVFVMIASALIRTLPLTPGDIGPYEVVLSQAVILLGVEPAAAGSYAIGAHLVLLALSGLLGLVALRALDLRLGDVIARPSLEDEPAPSEVSQPRSG